MNNILFNLMIIGYIVSNYYIGKEILIPLSKVTEKQIVLNNIKMGIIVILLITPAFNISILKYGWATLK